MTKRAVEHTLTVAETAAQLAIPVEELLALVQAGEIGYRTTHPGPVAAWQTEHIDQLFFEQSDIDTFNEGFTISAFAARLGVRALQVRRAIEDGAVAVTILDDGRYAKPRQRIRRADFPRAAAGFQRWQKRGGA